MLEAGQYEGNTFATLTYSPELEPAGGNLVPKDMQLFLKRLRKSVPFKVRYYGVGEYGDQNNRPHFHLALFNYPNCDYGQSRYSNIRPTCCRQCELIRQAWGKGHIFLGTLSVESAQYIAGYITKAMTKPDDDRLNGRHPEFARMSLRPGIGGDAVHELASSHLEHDLVQRNGGDVVTSLRHGSRIMPLGRYLTRRLRKYSGMAESAPEVTLQAQKAKMQPLLQAAVDATSSPATRSLRKLVYKNLILDANVQKIRNIEGRMKLRKKRSHI